MAIIEEVETVEKTETQEVAGKHILYVEDNPTNRRLMEVLFRKQPHTLQMAETGELGWDSAIKHDFDLILMDIHLPEMDGNELTQKLRETDRYKSKPIVAITAAAMKHDIESAEGLFDDYVTKPLEFSKLLTILNKYLS